MQCEQLEQGSWVTLKMNPIYEIYDHAPHYIRKGNTIYKPSLSSNSGYAIYHLKGIPESLHHRIIASQFCDNDDPEHKTVVNHIDGNIKNNSYTNLEWLSQSDNIKLRAKYKQQPHVTVEALPPNAICVGDYCGHTFSRYWVDGEHLIMQCKRGSDKNKVKYKYVNASPYKNGNHRSVTIFDDAGCKVIRGLTKLLNTVNARVDTPTPKVQCMC